MSPFSAMSDIVSTEMITPEMIVPDPAYDILRSERQPLRAIFAPQTVAVIGASSTPGSVGHTLLWNLISNSFPGTIFPVNPKHASVMGIQAYPNIASVPAPVDLAVIATPAHTIPAIMRECVQAKVKGAVIVSAGFKEIGADGIALEQEILSIARQGQLRIVGPNCLGVMNPYSHLNATFASCMARPGNVGFISQSGALCTAVLDWSLRENVGFSIFASIGSMLDVDWGNLIDYLGDDPHTHSIVIYMESIGNPRSFLSAAREVALTKPIIVIKAGRTEAAAHAAASHTGALTGSDDVFNAALRRCGVLRVNQIAELFDMAEVLAKQPRPKGPRLTIITNAGGAGVLATDALVSGGGQLAAISPDTITQLSDHLPRYWSHSNPIDILGDATPERYAKTLAVAAQEAETDGLLVILTPQAMTDPTQTAQELVNQVQELQAGTLHHKPILAAWMGGDEIEAGQALLNQANIPTYLYPDAATQVFNYMWQYSDNLRSIYETPVLAKDCEYTPSCRLPDGQSVEQFLTAVRQENRTLLTEAESKQLLAAYGLPVVPTAVATSPEAALELANDMGYPVALKLYSHTITHKTDVGGVQLNLSTPQAVQVAYADILHSVTTKVGAEHFAGVTVQPMIDRQNGYELILGSSIDPQFGPVLLFGLGGQMVEVFRDRAIALPPLNSTLARRMMAETKIYHALQGTRGRAAVDLDGLEQLLVRFSQLVLEQPWIKEIDINPLLASPVDLNPGHSLQILDARIVLHPPETPTSQLPKPTILPYPSQYVSTWKLRDGRQVTIRPIRPEDEPLVVEFHRSLSEQSVYMRYFQCLKLSQRIAHERLTRLCFLDYDREMALVADYQNLDTGKHEILAIGRLSQLHGIPEAEFALLVTDHSQGLGLGTEILQRLVHVAIDKQITRIGADILPTNTAMQRVCTKVGFQLQKTAGVINAAWTG